MRFIRTGALIAGTLSLTLLLSGCFGAGEDDVNPAHNCPGCGAPLGPSPPSPSFR
jgi:hypothetical protein